MNALYFAQNASTIMSGSSCVVSFVVEYAIKVNQDIRYTV